MLLQTIRLLRFRRKFLPLMTKRNFGKDINIPKQCSNVGRTTFQSLQGRDLITFDGYTRNDIFSLLWVVNELKALKPSQSERKKVCLIWSNPVSTVSVSHATQEINGSLCCIHEDQLISSMSNLNMLGRSLGVAADIIFIDTQTWTCDNIDEFATGCTCPVIVISSNDFSPVLAYSEMFTLFEKHGFLRRLVMTCISPGSGSNDTMLNTYFSLLPTVGMHLRYLIHGPLENQSAWETCLKLSSRNNTEMKQFESIHDALYRSHCLSISFSESSSLPLINLKDVKEMDLDWSIVQHDSHKGLSVSIDFLKDNNHNLIFKVVENQTWVYQALILAHTTDYSPKSPPPRFEGVD